MSFPWHVHTIFVGGAEIGLLSQQMSHCMTRPPPPPPPKKWDRDLLKGGNLPLMGNYTLVIFDLGNKFYSEIQFAPPIWKIGIQLFF